MDVDTLAHAWRNKVMDLAWEHLPRLKVYLFYDVDIACQEVVSLHITFYDERVVMEPSDSTPALPRRCYVEIAVLRAKDHLSDQCFVRQAATPAPRFLDVTPRQVLDAVEDLFKLIIPLLQEQHVPGDPQHWGP